ncbi:unnamed protein product [Bursaphelenchus okinawaensis]|uniref:Uncharacterized protein n=1 Tax=Bursaphelenchus okinawaensis TaxID=465554 RepID=A0A811LEX1_9BILA|nr:unnamed protein product [Bursaphelenchus okinawaensis]CAG9124002.1 unnamed protein product [Bursaphelenchus okinawaensis]
MLSTIKLLFIALIGLILVSEFAHASPHYSWSSSQMKFMRRFGGYGGYGGYYPGGFYQPPVYAWPYGK